MTTPNVAAEYLPTNLNYLDYMMIPLSAMLVALLIIGAFAVINRNKENSRSSDLETVLKTAMGILLTAIVFISILIPSTVSFAQNKENLTSNIMKNYDIDEIDYKSSNTEKMTADVFKGDKAYNVIVKENPETFEPTLISYENNADISELKR